GPDVRFGGTLEKGTTLYLRAFAQRLRHKRLTDRSKVPVEPVEDFFDEHVRRRDVAGFEHYMPLVFFRGAEHAEHWVLRGFLGKEEIVAAIDHQHRYLHARREIEWVHLGQSFLVFKSAPDPQRGLDTRLRGGKDRP